MRFRPCIDLHSGQVKQIVGSTLTDNPAALKTNFTATLSAAEFAAMYQRDALVGGHVIMLGGGNEAAALSALAAYPGGLQVGGGVCAENARKYIGAGASHVIVTSWIFVDGKLSRERLAELVAAVGKPRSAPAAAIRGGCEREAASASSRAAPLAPAPRRAHLTL
jgi:phosphoribosylformimino-5-aminoimidazole carboxamide ribotide isomerase